MLFVKKVCSYRIHFTGINIRKNCRSVSYKVYACIMLAVYVYTSGKESRPTMKQLQEVMRIKDIDIITQWRDLGLELVDSNKILKVIEADHRNDVTTCCRVMFEKWLEVKPDASWDQLVTALKNIKLNTAADAVSKLFNSTSGN